MIRVFVFDLDGTLVQTERLRAESYAKAIVELCPYTVDEADAVDGYRDVVGQSKREVAEHLVTRFNLTETASARMADYGVDTPWEVLIQVRLKYYDRLACDADILRAAVWPHNVALLKFARGVGCRTALASMSSASRIDEVLGALDVREDFDFIASGDDVKHGKPDPEIYGLVATHFGFSPQECLVIEDSPDGIKSAVDAGMHCVAVTTPFSRRRVLESDLLPQERIVNEPDQLMRVVRDIVDIEAAGRPM